jgi:hypothetical protein
MATTTPETRKKMQQRGREWPTPEAREKMRTAAAQRFGKKPKRAEADISEAASSEERQASEIFVRIDRELTSLEERTQRLMYQYGL